MKVWKVFGDYVDRAEMNMTMPPFDDLRVRQAVNYLVLREQIIKAVYFDTARMTKSPISEIYPGYTDKNFPYGSEADIDKAKALLAEAGLTKGFKTQIGYHAGNQIEEEIAVFLKSALRRRTSILSSSSCRPRPSSSATPRAKSPCGSSTTWRSSPIPPMSPISG